MNARRLLGLGGLVLALAVGCGPAKVPTGTINGKLTHNGKPAAEGTLVQFSGPTGGGNGTSAADGTFATQGVPVGKYRVSVASPAFPSDPKAAMEAAMKAQQEGKDLNSAQGKIPQKYMSPDTSGETFEVREGVNSYSLDMKD